MGRPIISIIMPAYNAENTIEMALNSIRMQNLDQKLVEILVIDGGSTDATTEIAKKYGAKIIFNEKRLPEPAKSIGLQAANGRYVVKNDADEVYIRNDQLEKRLNLLKECPDVKCVLADQLVPPKGSAFSSAYLNMIGDPFTFFIYKSKGTVTMNFKKHAVKNIEGNRVFHFSDNDILPIGDSGTTMIDMDYVRENFGDMLPQQSFASTIFDDVVRKTGYVACIENDTILHYSSATLRIYLKKLKFRIINNIFNMNESGYAARAVNNNRMRLRKYIYPFYCISILWPLFDSFKLSIRFRDAGYMMHIFYSFYVLAEILLQYIKKMLGKQTVNEFYGAK